VTLKKGALQCANDSKVFFFFWGMKLGEVFVCVS
jgi:hypothetical protein